MKVRIFTPAFNVENSISRLITELEDVERLLAHHSHELKVLIINDNSTDGTSQILDKVSKKFDWLDVHHNEENLGNADNIITGYIWGVDSDVDVVGNFDSDGEHSPYAMIRHLQMIESGECDGIVGSIIFPDHSINHHDQTMMKFWGRTQATMAGIDGIFYVQSPGYNLHQRQRVADALELFKKYQTFFAANTVEAFPRWGLHGVMIHLIAVGTGAHIKAAYLECFGKPSNRTSDKRVLQVNAANIHNIMLTKFLPKR